MRLFTYICIMACVVHITQGANIHNHWIKQKNAPQPKKSPFITYWLLTPEYNDYVLIQVKKGQKPSLDTNTQTGNFSYVDPTYEHPGTGFHTLDKSYNKGLYYWQSDHISKLKAQDYTQKHNTSLTPYLAKGAYIVRHHPNGQPFAETTITRNKENIYASLANTKISPQGQIPRKFQWDGSQKSLHPQDMTVLTQPPEHMLTKSDITVTTANTLAQGPYNNHIKPQVAQMPLNVRQHLFKNATQNPYIFWGSDFICVQEWDQQLAKGITGYHYIREQVSKNPKKNMTSGIFYDKNRWNNIGYQTIQIQGKDQIVATFTDGNKTVTVASCHNPSAPSEQKSRNTLNRVYQEAQTQSQNNGNCPVIFVGDFNYNTYDQAYITHYAPNQKPKKSYNNLAQYLSPLQDAAAHHKAKKVQITYNQVPTAYDEGYTHMDYIWHSPSLKCTSYAMFPNNNNLEHLIKHSKEPQQPDFSYHFSDHAILRATFNYQQVPLTPQQLTEFTTSFEDLYTQLEYLAHKHIW